MTLITRNGIIILALVVMVWIASSCGGSGEKITPQPTVKGSIKGTFVVNNLLPEGASFMAELFAKGASSSMSSQALTVVDDKLSFDFGERSLGTYFIKLKATLGEDTFTLNQTGDLAIDSDFPDLNVESESAMGIDGTISGIIQLAGEFPTELAVYVNVFRTDVELAPGPPDGLNSLIFDITEEMIENDSVRYDIENMSYGIYHVALLGYDPVTHEVVTFGEYPEDVLLDYVDHNPFSKNFGAGFGVEPPVVENGVIRGTVSFIGDSVFREGYSIYVSANTIPPGAGAPPGNVQVFEEAYDPAGFFFEMTDLVYGEYSVSIYEYNFTTHTPTYFGWYEGTVTLTAESPTVEGIVFQADWTLLG